VKGPAKAGLSLFGAIASRRAASPATHM
jgi:hypothetical protein